MPRTDRPDCARTYDEDWRPPTFANNNDPLPTWEQSRRRETIEKHDLGTKPTTDLLQRFRRFDKTMRPYTGFAYSFPLQKEPTEQSLLEPRTNWDPQFCAPSLPVSASRSASSSSSEASNGFNRTWPLSLGGRSPLQPATVFRTARKRVSPERVSIELAALFFTRCFLGRCSSPCSSSARCSTTSHKNQYQLFVKSWEISLLTPPSLACYTAAPPPPILPPFTPPPAPPHPPPENTKSDLKQPFP